MRSGLGRSTRKADPPRGLAADDRGVAGETLALVAGDRERFLVGSP